MANGMMMSTTQNGLKPDKRMVKTIKMEAMEFLEAKKPLVVEMRPVKARAREARPIIGARKTDWILPLQEKNGRKASLMLAKKAPQEKLSIKKSVLAVSGKRNTS